MKKPPRFPHFSKSPQGQFLLVQLSSAYRAFVKCVFAVKLGREKETMVAQGFIGNITKLVERDCDHRGYSDW